MNRELVIACHEILGGILEQMPAPFAMDSDERASYRYLVDARISLSYALRLMEAGE